MKLYEKRESAQSNPYFQGRYRNNSIKISSSTHERFYYLINGDITYSSLLNNEEFGSVEEAAKAAQLHIDWIKA